MPRMYEHVAPVVLIANPWQVEADCLICAIRSYNQQQSNHTYHVLHNQNQDRHRCLHCQCNQLQQPRRRLWQLSSASGKEKWLTKLWQEQKWIIFFFCILSWLKLELLAQIRGGICHSRHSRRECKIFASGLNFFRNNAVCYINESRKLHSILISSLKLLTYY